MKRKTDTTIGRIYHPELLLDVDIIKAILGRFRYDVPAIFQEDLAFGCIVGGFAKGYAVSDQDIDMFVCLHKYDEQKVEAFMDFYYNIHKEFHLVPDTENPGVVTTLGYLSQKIALINARSLRKTIESYYESQGLVWTEMLTGARSAQIGNMSILNSILESCELLPQKWRKEVYDILGDDIPDDIKKLPIHRLIKYARKRGYIKYEKYGRGFANNVEEAYPYMKQEDKEHNK